MYIFLIPFLFDYVVGGVFFITGYNLAEAGMNAFIVASPMTIWGISYAVNSLIFGRIIHRGNAGFFLQLFMLRPLNCVWNLCLCRNFTNLPVLPPVTPPALELAPQAPQNAKRRQDFSCRQFVGRHHRSGKP